MSEYDADANFKVIKAIVICTDTGLYLVDHVLDTSIDPIMLASFISALAKFADANMGKIQEISVKGLDMELIIIAKYGLILIALMDRDFYKDIVREHGARILDLFYKMFEHHLDDVSEIDKFEKFKDYIFSEIIVCLKRMKDLQEKRGHLKAGLEYDGL